MTTLTIHVDNKKSEKVIKAVLEALGVEYEEQGTSTEYPQHVIDGVKLAKEDIASGKVKEYKGLNSVLGR